MDPRKSCTQAEDAAGNPQQLPPKQSMLNAWVHNRPLPRVLRAQPSSVAGMPTRGPIEFQPLHSGMMEFLLPKMREDGNLVSSAQVPIVEIEKNTMDSRPENAEGRHACPLYHGGHDSAMLELQRAMQGSSVCDQFAPTSTPCMAPFMPALENMGGTSLGLPQASLYTVATPSSIIPNVQLHGTVSNQLDPVIQLHGATSTQLDLAMRIHSDARKMDTSPTTIVANIGEDITIAEGGILSKRAIQRRAELNYANHKKANDGTRFKVAIDAAGNILANKMRVTSLLNKLTTLYLDIAQIHYNDNDKRFRLIESIVNSKFEFDSPLKPGWMVDYMKRQLEKERAVFKKHWDETGTMHKDCPASKHAALLAWWSSPAGSSKGQRMREMNKARAAQRNSIEIGGTQSKPLCLQRLTPEIQEKGVPDEVRPQTVASGNSVVAVAQHRNHDSEKSSFSPSLEDDGLPTEEMVGAEVACNALPLATTSEMHESTLRRMEEDMVVVKRNVTDILSRLQLLDSIPRLLEQVQGVIDQPFQHEGNTIVPKSNVGAEKEQHTASTSSECHDVLVQNVGFDACMVDQRVDTKTKKRGRADNQDTKIEMVKSVSDLGLGTDGQLDSIMEAEVQNDGIDSTCGVGDGNAITNGGCEQQNIPAIAEIEMASSKKKVRVAEFEEPRPYYCSSVPETNEYITGTHVATRTVVEEPMVKSKRRATSGHGQGWKKSNKFFEHVPPASLTPKKEQVKFPLGINKDVWVIHPAHAEPVALGKTGYSFKTTKAKLQASPWRTLRWEGGMQLVEILKVFHRGIKVMHSSNQPIKGVKTLDDVCEAVYSDDALVMWGSEYLIHAAAKQK